MDKEQLRRRAEHTICEGCEARDLLIERLEARCARYREALEKIASASDVVTVSPSMNQISRFSRVDCVFIAATALTPSPKQREEAGLGRGAMDE